MFESPWAAASPLASALLRLALAVAFGLPGPAVAELDSGDYAPAQAITSPAERARVQALLDAARVRETERAALLEAAAAAAAERATAAQAAAWAARPLGARLAEQYCTACHAPELLAAARHTAPGWAFTIARMRWLNGAAVPAADAARIRAHLARTQPAGPLQAALEYGGLGLGIAGLLWLLRWVFRRLWHRWRAPRRTLDPEA